MDVDIDFKTDFDPLDYFKTAIRASRVENKTLVKHNAGAYFQNIPVDEQTGLAAIPFEQAEEIGYFKIDFLHLSILDKVKSKEQIRILLRKEVDWSLFQNKEIVHQLFQIKNHFDVVYQAKPKSVEDLADIVALIRPGKRGLLNSYIKNKSDVRKHLYKKEDNQYSFKKSHAIAYALTIILHLHLLNYK